MASMVKLEKGVEVSDFLEDQEDILVTTGGADVALENNVVQEESKKLDMNRQPEQTPEAVSSKVSVSVMPRRRSKPLQLPTDMEIFDYKVNPKKRTTHPLKIKISKTRKQGTDGMIHCLLCGQRFETYHKYIVHLSRVHYKEEVMNCYHSDDTNWICPICKKKFGKKIKFSQSQSQRLSHLGVAHEHVLSVAHKAVKTQLDDLRAFGKAYKINNKAWDRCRTHFENREAEACCNSFTNDPQQLRFHIANSHYKGDLIARYGVVGKPCNLCKLDRQIVAANDKDIVLHIISTHPKTLYSLMPDCEAKLLSRCLKGDMNTNSMFVPDNYICPLCDLPRDTPNLLRVHLSVTHFSHQLLKAANNEADMTKCTICEQSIGKPSSRKSQSHLRRLLASHIGCKHGYLEKVLPQDVLSTLKEIEKKGKQKVMKLRDEKIQEHLVAFSKHSVKCPLCEQVFKSVISIKTHLAGQHFADEISRLAGLTDINQCPICGKKLLLSRSNSGMAGHIGLVHKYLDKVMPMETKRELNNEFAKKFPQSAPFNIQELGANTSESRNLDEVLIASNKHISCMLCEAKFHTINLLRHHLISVHFKVAVLKKAGTTDPRRCNLCGKNMGGEKTDKWPSLLVCHMAIHIGNAHKMLEEVMAEDVRERLKIITEAERKVRGRKPKLKTLEIDPLKI